MAWYNTTVTAGQDRMIAHYSHLIGRVWSDQSNQSKRNQKGVLTLEQGPLKSIQSCKDYYDKWSWPIRTIQKSLRVTRMLPAISLGQ
jgi:hypothetical protein